jgi:hypothetical protein
VLWMRAHNIDALRKELLAPEPRRCKQRLYDFE